jgi:hypothetical protein
MPEIGAGRPSGSPSPRVLMKGGPAHVQTREVVRDGDGLCESCMCEVR